MKGMFTTGVSCEASVRSSTVAMGVTALLYIMIQVPAMTKSFTIANAPKTNAEALAVAAFERPFAIIALVASIVAFVVYLAFMAAGASHNAVLTYRVEEMRIQMIKAGQLTLVGAMAHLVDRLDDLPSEISRTPEMLRAPLAHSEANSAARGGVVSGGDKQAVMQEIRDTLRPFFQRYDADGSHAIDGTELRVLFADLHEKLGPVEIAAFAHASAAHGLEILNDQAEISFDAFVDMVIAYIRRRGSMLADHRHDYLEVEAGLLRQATPEAAPAGEEEDEAGDEMPDELRDLPPEEQYRRAKWAAAKMLLGGTALVVGFSDPMVGVLSEIAVRTSVPPFYVAFILAPMASNGAEVLSAYSFAKRKSARATTISFSTLIGAAVMNNTFCLAVFMGLIVARGDLYWEYTAETIAILVVEIAMLWFGSKTDHRLIDGVLVGLLYPLGLAIVVALEAAGLD